LHVLGDTSLHVAEGLVVTRSAQLGEIRLRVALVAPLEIVGKRNVAQQPLLYLIRKSEFGFAARTTNTVHHGGGNIVERLGAARAAIEYAGDFRVVDEMQIDVHHVVDMNEVAHLSAVIVTVPAAEQAHVAVLYELIEVVEGYRRHATF